MSPGLQPDSRNAWAVWFERADAESTSVNEGAVAVAAAIKARMQRPVEPDAASPTSENDEYDFSEIARPREGAPHVYG